MKLILSIETATPVASVALHGSGRLVTAIEHHVPRSHSSVLLDMVAQLLSMLKGGMKQLAAIAVSAGPGSYTGLRVGVALAKGLCYGRDLPLISIGTLVSVVQGGLAYTIPPKGVWCPLLDAGQGKAYGLVADAQGRELTGRHKYEVALKTFEKWLAQAPVYFIGSGADSYVHVLKKHPHSCFIKGVYPKASDMGRIAYAKFLKNEFVDKACFEPLY